MKYRKVPNKKRYLYAILARIAVFILGLSITYAIADIEFNRIVGLQDPISYEIFQDKLKYNLFNKSICSEKDYIEISKDLDPSSSN